MIIEKCNWEKISEKQARFMVRIFEAVIGASISLGMADEIIERLNKYGVVKKSKLEEAREFVKAHTPTHVPDNEIRNYNYGINDAATRYEAAIAEIIEAHK